MSLTQTLLRSPTVAALTSPHGVDRYLELVNPMWAAHEVRARVVASSARRCDVTTLTLQPTNTWLGFRAGQHVQLGVEIDGSAHTRIFSISSSDLQPKLTGDRTFTITVRGHDEGLVSRHLARHAEVGTVVHLSQAEGDFVLPTAAAAQAAADLRRLRHHPGDVDAARRCVDSATRAALHLRALRPQPRGDDLRRGARRARRSAPTSTSPSLHTRTGDKRLNELQLERLVPDLPRHPDVRPAARPAWSRPSSGVRRPRHAARGVLQDLQHHREPRPRRPPSGTVSFARAGTAAENSGMPILLEQAEALGLAPEYGCRMGICFSCTSRKTEGTVRNVVTGAESSLPDEDIQICVSQPVGDCVVDL